MTPLQLCIVIHYYYSASDFREGDFTAPAVRAGIDWLRDRLGMIEAGSEGVKYKITERGIAYIRAVLAVDYPVQVWVSPAQARSLLSTAG